MRGNSDTSRRHRARGALFGALLLLFLLTGQVAAAFHRHGELLSRRNCPVCVQSAHDAAVPEAGFDAVFGAHPETVSPEPSDEVPPTPTPAPADARSPPSCSLSA